MSKLLIDNGSIEPKITEVYNQNGGGYLKFWKGTLAQYNSLTASEIDDSTVYFIEQDATS